MSTDDNPDLQSLLRLFDTALTSDDPRVKDALRNLLVIAALVQSENTDRDQRLGPLRSMMERVKSMDSRISVLELNRNGSWKTTPNTWPSTQPWTTWPNTQPWTSSPASPWTITYGTNTSANSSSMSTSGISSALSGMMSSTVELRDLLMSPINPGHIPPSVFDDKED